MAADGKKEAKDAILQQIKCLNHEKDDERTMLSKLISWILRRGAEVAGVRQDPGNKWVKFSDLCAAEVLKEYSSDYIWQVIVDFNGKKLRYEINEAEGGPYLRAYKRSEVEERGEVLKPMSQKSTRKSTGGEQDEEQKEGEGSQGYNPYEQQMMNPYMNQMMMMQLMSNPYMWQQAAANAQGKYQGWVKSINVEKGFGFIGCAQTYSQYQRDVFLHKAQLSGLEVGSNVVFSCEVSKQGMPQARDVKVLPQVPQIAAAMAHMEKGKGKGKGKDGKGKGKEGGKDGKGKGKKGKKGGGGEEKKERRPTLEAPKEVVADLNDDNPTAVAEARRKSTAESGMLEAAANAATAATAAAAEAAS